MLAAGLVLGIGSSVTLASWQDEQHASATLSASTFALEGSTDGSTYQRQHTENDDTPAQLDFGLEDTALSPGDTVYAQFSVRTTEDTTVGGTLWLTADSGNTAGLGQWLRYAVAVTDQPRCQSAADFTSGTEIIGRSVQANLATSPANLTHELSAGAANTVNYCFEVTLPENTPNTAQGQRLEASWTVHGQSE